MTHAFSYFYAIHHTINKTTAVLPVCPSKLHAKPTHHIPTPMNKIYVLLLAALAAWNFGTTELRAQKSDWVTYSDMRHITDIAQEGNILWIITASGVTQVDRTTLEATLVTREDMSLPTILSFAVQKNGIKWFGTQYEGLIMLDNDRVEIFTPQNSPVRIPNPVAQGNNIWMRAGTDTLIRYDRPNWHITDVSDIVEGADNIGLLYGDEQTLWAGSFVYGSTNASCTAIYRLSNGEWKSIALPAGSSFTSISPVGSHNGALWLNGIHQENNTTVADLVRYDGTTWTIFTGEELGTQIQPQALTIDSSGQVWLPTAENSILRYDGIAWQTIGLTDTPLDSANITVMFTDSDGIVWAGTEKKGLFQYNKNLWSAVAIPSIEMPTYIPSPSEHTGDWLSSIVVDTDQSLWLNYATDIETHVYGNTGRIEPLPFGGMATQQLCAVDKKGGRWIASVYGLWRRFNASWEKVSDEKFTSLYIDRADNLWLGTSEGVARYTDGEWTYYTSENSDFYSTCIAITQDKSGILWAATPDKLLTFDGNTWTVVDTQYPEEIFGGSVYPHIGTMIADSTGLLWMRSNYQEEIFTFDGTTWTKYTPENTPLTSGFYISMITDRTGNIWIGASENNFTGRSTNKLLRVDHATREWTAFTPHDSPLPYGQITCLAVDSSNNLWIGTVDPHKLVGYRQGGVLVSVDEQFTTPIQPIDVASFPNPTAAQTTIRYTVPPSTGVVPVHIQLFNTLGVPVRTLEQSTKPSGEHTLDVDTTPLTSGTYYYRIHVGGNVQTQQLIVVK